MHMGFVELERAIQRAKLTPYPAVLESPWRPYATQFANADGSFDRKMLFGLTVSSAMTAQKRRVDFDGWIEGWQREWGATKVINRGSRKVGPVGDHKPIRHLDRAWDTAKMNIHDRSGLPTEEQKQYLRGQVPETKPMLQAALAVMFEECERLGHVTPAVAARRMAERLGVSHTRASQLMHELRKLGLVALKSRGEHYDPERSMSGRVYKANVWAFNTPLNTSKAVYSENPIRGGFYVSPCARKARSHALTIREMRLMAMNFGHLTYQIVQDHGGGVLEWRKWLRFLRDRHGKAHSAAIAEADFSGDSTRELLEAVLTAESDADGNRADRDFEARAALRCEAYFQGRYSGYR